jgi:PAS domain S-box-containing protein
VGAVDYLAKPFQPDILRSKVGVFVDLYLKQKQLSEQQVLLRASEVRELELKHKLEMTESEARLSDIVASAMDAIIAFDTDGQISLFNAAAARMFGVRAHDAVGHDVRKLMPEPLRQESLDRVCRASDTAQSGAQTEPSEHILSLTGLRSSGEEFPIEATASCLDVAASAPTR